MAKWLFKTEPSDYSFEDLLCDKRVTWDGVKNPLALKHLRDVKKGDPVAIYHTGGVKAVVGIARVASARDGVVDLAPVRPVDSVPLSSIKADRNFKDFPLVRMGRLSVMPVPEALWEPLTGSAKSKARKPRAQEMKQRP